MQRFVLTVLGVLATIGATATPAVADTTRSITLQMTGTATVLGCAEGGAPPCTGAERVAYSGQASGDPFSSFNYRGPASVRGYIDIPAAGFDAGTGCYSGILGVFELLTLRGPREFLAFAEDLQGGHSCGTGGHSYLTAFTVDATNTQDPNFRDATGSGTMSLQDNAVYGTPGVFSAGQSGTITTVR